LLARITGKTKVTDHRKTDIGSPVLQVLHSEGIVTIDHQETTEEGIRLTYDDFLHNPMRAER
jgi:hypothetical protein